MSGTSFESFFAQAGMLYGRYLPGAFVGISVAKIGFLFWKKQQPQVSDAIEVVVATAFYPPLVVTAPLTVFLYTRGERMTISTDWKILIEKD